MRRGPTKLAIVMGAPFLLLVIWACRPISDERSEESLPEQNQRIVLVSADGLVYSVDVDGSNRRLVLDSIEVASVNLPSSTSPQLKGGVSYFWPTWSPLGDGVAVSRTPGLERHSSFSLVVATAYVKDPQLVHNSPPGSNSMVARNAPHYVQWAPNGALLTLLTADSDPRNEAVELFVIDERGTGKPSFITSLAPLYHIWTPDSSGVLIHSQEKLLLYSIADGTLADVGSQSSLYRTPAISPDGSHYAFVTDAPEGPILGIWSVADRTLRKLLDIERRTSFLWSPADDVLAITFESEASPNLNEGVSLVDLDTNELQVITEKEVIAFFWSPNGERLAVIERGVGSLLKWSVIDVASGEEIAETPYSPSLDNATLLTFFDQYTHSHSPWSQDSSSLVFAGQVPATDPGHSGGSNSIYVFNIDRNRTGSPTVIAQGNLAFWIPAMTP